MFRKLAATAAVTAALLSPAALSLGLGKIDADSGLNQPLKAEITLLSSNNVSEEDLRAKLASYDAYNKFGVQREAYHNTLSFRIITKNDGSKAIVVESREAVKEPFINFLVELNWAQGRLMREYTLLLDPPVFSKATVTPKINNIPSSQRQAAVKQKPTQPRQVEREVDSTAKATSKPETKPVADEAQSQPMVSEDTRRLAATPDFSDDSWTVERGQTLWSIAKSVRPEGASVQQTLMAIFHNNPDAFINNDINQMKAGAVLAVPERSAINDVSQTAAVNTIRNSSVNSDAPLDVRKSVDETSVEQTVEQGGRLSIASVDEGSLEDSGGSVLDDDATADSAKPEDASSETSLSDAGDISSDFGTDLAESESASDDGITIEDETLSVLSGAADAVDRTDEVLADDAASDIAADTVVESGLTDSAGDDVAVDEEKSDNAQSNVADSVDSKPAASNSLQQDSDKAFYEAENFWLYAGGGLILLLLLGGGIVYRRNSKEVEDDGGLLGMMTAANESKPKKRRETSFGDEGMKAPKHDVDAISTADILIAKGKLSDAEKVLEDALAAKPNNQEARVKLMEVVASQQNSEKFFELKKELPSDFDHDSALGLKVASLTSLVTPEDDGMLMEDTSDDINLPSEDDIFGHEKKEPAELDLSSELSSKEVDVDTVSDDDSLDLDLGDFEKQTPVNVESVAPESEDNSIDFSANQDDEELVTQEDDSVTNDVSEDFSSDEAGLSESDAATKFDLAKAYMELGDDDAARDILEEIKSEGNKAQREEADKLLSDM